MATIPWSEIRKSMTPEQLACSDAKAEKLRIGIFIAEHRQKNNLTQQDLADKLGISQQAVSKMEWGEDIQLSTLRRVVFALGGEIVLHMPTGDINLGELVSG